MSTVCENFGSIAHELRSERIFVFRTFLVFCGSFWNKTGFFSQLFWCSFSVCFGSFWNKTVSFGCFHVHFWFVLVHFETNLFVSLVSKIFIGFENEPKQTQNRSCFGYFRFELKFFFYSFRGHLSCHSFGAFFLIFDIRKHLFGPCSIFHPGYFGGSTPKLHDN